MDGKLGITLSYGLSNYAIRIFSPKHIPSVLQMSKIFWQFPPQKLLNSCRFNLFRRELGSVNLSFLCLRCSIQFEIDGFLLLCKCDLFSSSE